MLYYAQPWKQFESMLCIAQSRVQVASALSLACSVFLLQQWGNGFGSAQMVAEMLLPSSACV